MERLSLWSGLGWQAQVVALMDKPFRGPGAMLPGKFFGPFVAPLWILIAGCRKRVFGDFGFVVVVFERKKKLYCRILYFSLIIVKSLQLRGRRQIAKPLKYYLVRVIVFLWRVFSLFFFFLTGWEFWDNSL